MLNDGLSPSLSFFFLWLVVTVAVIRSISYSVTRCSPPGSIGTSAYDDSPSSRRRRRARAEPMSAMACSEWSTGHRSVCARWCGNAGVPLREQDLGVDGGLRRHRRDRVVIHIVDRQTQPVRGQRLCHHPAEHPGMPRDRSSCGCRRGRCGNRQARCSRRRNRAQCIGRTVRHSSVAMSGGTDHRCTHHTVVFQSSGSSLTSWQSCTFQNPGGSVPTVNHQSKCFNDARSEAVVQTLDARGVRTNDGRGTTPIGTRRVSSGPNTKSSRRWMRCRVTPIVPGCRRLRPWVLVVQNPRRGPVVSRGVHHRKPPVHLRGAFGGHPGAHGSRFVFFQRATIAVVCAGQRRWRGSRGSGAAKPSRR